MDKVLDYVLYFFFYSVVGWILETVCCSLYYGKLINRGFMKGPVVPIYGAGAVVLGAILMPFYHKFGYTWYVIILVMLLGVVIADILEYLTSFAMEKLFNARWWDYSNEKFNLHGRICLKHSIYWLIATGSYIYIVHPFVEKMIQQYVTDKARNIIIVVAAVVFAVDLFFTVKNSKSGKFRNAVEDINKN